MLTIVSPTATEKEQRTQQEGPRPRQAHPVLQLLAMHSQGQGYQEIHHPQHGRVCCYPYVEKTAYLPTPWPCSAACDAVRTTGQFYLHANTRLFQVTSLTPRSSPSTPSPRCTSSCSTASLAPFTARSFGTFVPDGGQLCLARCHDCLNGTSSTLLTQAAEMNLGGKRTPSP